MSELDAARPVRVRANGWGWRHASRRRPSLAELNFEISPGQRVLLLGPSGSGKSSLLAALAGLLGPEDGEAFGELLVGEAPAAERRVRPGLVLQDPETQIVMSRIGDEIAFAPENLRVPAAEIVLRLPVALAEVGLQLPLDHPTQALSGGQKQRLALASALAMRPGLLLLDEPTANLDPDGALAVRDAVQRSATDRTLIVVEHRIELWLPVVDRVLVLDADGRLSADGPPERVLAEQREALREMGVWLPGEIPHTRHDHRGGEDSSIRSFGGERSFTPSPRTPPLLSVEELTIGRDVPVLFGLEQQLADGEVLWLGGPNGVGKTTLLLTIAGLLAPHSGEVRAAPSLQPSRVDPRRAKQLRLAASEARAAPFAWRSRDLAARIGTVFQHPEHQFASHTVRGELAATALSPQRADELLERLGLTRLAEAHPTSLSGGQKRRLSVAIALGGEPQLLVLDEPTFGQDARTWATLVELLAERQRAGGTIIMASHDEALAERLASRRWMLAAAQAVDAR